MTEKKVPFIYLGPNPVPFAITESFVITFNGNSAGVLDYKCFQPGAASTSVTCTGLTAVSECSNPAQQKPPSSQNSQEMLKKSNSTKLHVLFLKLSIIFQAFQLLSNFSLRLHLALTSQFSSTIGLRNLAFL